MALKYETKRYIALEYTNYCRFRKSTSPSLYEFKTRLLDKLRTSSGRSVIRHKANIDGNLQDFDRYLKELRIRLKQDS